VGLLERSTENLSKLASENEIAAILKSQSARRGAPSTKQFYPNQKTKGA
jgi:hypothetical protein